LNPSTSVNSYHYFRQGTSFGHRIFPAEGTNRPGERVLSFSVQGHEYRDFDVWVKAGEPWKAYVETVNVEVTNGVIKITFTPNVENPQINGIEILSQPSPGSGLPDLECGRL
jgi:hypothetical protein